MIERLTNQLVQDGISTITLYAEPQVCLCFVRGRVTWAVVCVPVCGEHVWMFLALKG